MENTTKPHFDDYFHTPTGRTTFLYRSHTALTADWNINTLLTQHTCINTYESASNQMFYSEPSEIGITPKANAESEINKTFYGSHRRPDDLISIPLNKCINEMTLCKP
jgi:hypothetical protein